MTIAPRLMTACAVPLLLAAAPPGQDRVARVIDGDTFQLTSGERIRIAGIDAAETQLRQAKCRAEIATGKQQTADARRLIEGRIVGLVRVGRSYNRTVARASLQGRDVAAALVGIGAARWWPRGARKPSWCKRARR